MRIDSLQLFQFRNYKDVTIQFNPEIIVLHGTNGAGKTNNPRIDLCGYHW